MRVISVNTNGIRAAARKGFFDWLAGQDADVVCIQETKAQEHQLDDSPFYPEGYHCFYSDAEKKGYSGTALYSKQQPNAVTQSLGWDPADNEGRYLQADLPNLTVISLYLPSGSSSEAAQEKKYRFLDLFEDKLQQLRQLDREVIICGDWNIAHHNIDLKNWKPNQKNSGFLPEERAWLSKVFDEFGYVDGFRVVNQEEGQYTWWSNRGRAWDNNVGWRIDYQVVTPGLKSLITGASIYKDQRFSDHAPLILDYDL